MTAAPRITPGSPSRADLSALHEGVLRWYAVHGRDLPWRRPDCSPWGVFLSEVMSQQTPMARVEPVWQRWMAQWPRPGDLAAAPPGEAVREWDRLGYPRRALRLHEAATAMVERHGGEVPASHDELLELPGVGPYTAAAVACFAFSEPEPVVDTNVRRVLARTITGVEHASPTLSRAETDLAAAVMPEGTASANAWNVAVMELGALVCTARSPRCDRCPVADRCAWNVAGRPAYDGPPRRSQRWHGTDRMVRGRIVQALREAPGPLPRQSLLEVWTEDAAKAERCLSALIEDGLVEPDGDHIRLPA